MPTLVVAVFCCVTLMNGAATAAVSWKRVGTVTTLTNNQMCYTDGTNVICDSSAPTISSGLVGIGSTGPITSLDMSQEHDALALPVGTTGTRPTGGNLIAGEIRYNQTSPPTVEAYVNGAWISLVGGASGGGGTANYVARWTSSTALGIGSLYDTGTQVGLGTTSPAHPLELDHTDTGTVKNSGIYANYTLTPASDETPAWTLWQSAIEGDLTIPVGNTHAMSQEIAGYFDVTNNSAANLGWELGGIYAQSVSTTGTNRWIGGGDLESLITGGTTTQIAGFYSSAGAGTGTTVTSDMVGGDMEAFLTGGTVSGGVTGALGWAEVDSGTTPQLTTGDFEGHVTGGTVTDAYGVYTDIGSTGGAITNYYGVYIDTDHTATNKWGLYQNDATANNYFAGNVGIGTTAPAEILTVNGNIAFPSTSAMQYIKTAYSGSPSLTLQFPDAGANTTDGIAIASTSGVGGAAQMLVSSRSVTFGSLAGSIYRNNGTSTNPIFNFTGDYAGYYAGGVLGGGYLGMYGSNASASPYQYSDYYTTASGGRHIFAFHQSIGEEDFDIALRNPPNFTTYGDRKSSATAVSLESNIPDSSTSEAVVVRSMNTYATAGANLFSAYNNTTREFYVDKGGGGYFAGSVGIGTTSPARPLHVVVSDASTTTETSYPLRLSHKTSGTAGDDLGTGIEFQVQNPSGTLETIGTYIGQRWADTSGTSSWWTMNMLTGGVMSNGGSGAGSDDPLDWGTWQGGSPGSYISELDLTSVGNEQPYIDLYRANGVTGAKTTVANGNVLGAYEWNGYDGTGWHSPARIMGVVNGTVATNSIPTDMTFETGTTGGGTEKMRITSGGYVGIGTTAPAVMLNIYSAAGAEPALEIDNAGSGQTSSSDIELITKDGGSGGGLLNVSGNKGWQISARGDSFSTPSQADYLMITYYNGTSWVNSGLDMAPSGNVSIGTATPATLLHVNGVETVGLNGGTGGQITLNGSTTGSVALSVAAAAGSGTVFQLPATNGSSGYILQTDGTGVTSWVAAPSPSFTGLTNTDFCTASGTTAIVCSTGYTGTGSVVLAASPTLTGTITAAAATFSGVITSTVATGTAPFTVASTTNVANLNASLLGGATFAAPGAIGGTTPGSGAFTTLSASSTVSGTGFSTYLASPPAIGGTAAAAGSFTTLGASGAITDTQAIAATSTDGLLLTDTTAATSGNQKWSPRVHFNGRGWETNTSASQSVDMIEELQPVQGGANPSGNLVWSDSINGGAYGALMTLTSGGNLTITGTFSGSGASLTAIPESALTALSANQVLGSLTAVAPSGLTMPSCSTTASALLWTSGTGFSCNASINAATLGGATFAAPGAIGSGTASTGAFTTLSASSTVSGAGFTAYMASPPAIGGTAAAAGNFTTLGASGATTDTRAPAANTSIDGLILTDTTAASSGNQQYSPRVHFTGQGWKTAATAASQAVDMIQELQPVQGGANPSGNLVWSDSINGGAYGAIMTLTTGGNLTITGTFSGSGASLTAIPESALTALSANQVLGSLTAVAPSGLTMPSCSTSASALLWTSGTGFSCNASINAATLGGATFAAPGAIGSGTASTGAFTTLSASSTVSGAGFTAYMASPPAIGGTAAAAGNFTTLGASGAATDTRAPAANTSIDGLILTDTTAATSGNQQYSPRVHFTGQGWKTTATAASQSVDMIEELQPVQGTTNPSGNLVWSDSINGGAYGALMTLTTGGSLGIGTTTPGDSLQIGTGLAFAPNWPTIGFNVGAVAFKYLGSNYGAYIQENYANGYLGISSYPSGTAGNAPSGGSELILASSGYSSFGGTSTPQSTLAVNGGVAIGTTYAGTNAAGSNNLIVQGSVGIGTASPLNALDVRGGGGYQINFMNTTATGSNYGQIGADSSGFTRVNGAAGASMDAGAIEVFRASTTAFTLGAYTNTATLSNNYASPAVQIDGQYWNGSASTVDTYSIQNVIASGSNPSTNLQFTHSGSSGGGGYSFSNGNVGIGTTSPGFLLDVEGSSTNTASQYIDALFSGAQSTANTSTYFGVKTAPTYTATSGNTLTSLVGITSAPANSSTGTVTTMSGDYVAPLNNSSGTVGSMYGVESIPTKVSTGVVTTMYGFYGRCDNKNATGAVTTCYDLYLDTPTTTGAITNVYGVYQADANTTNYFAGSVGIGGATPSYPLTVNGTVDASDLYLGAAWAVAALGYSNVYIGLNAVRSTNWTVPSDGAHNGGGAIWGDVSGDLYIATVPLSGTPTVSQTLTDAQLAADVRMFVSQYGNVGIGTATPGNLLETYDSAAKTWSYTGVLHDVLNTSSTASVNKVGMDIESTGTWNGTSAVNTGLIVNATGGTTNYAATFSGGNVGFGTTTPGANLDIEKARTGNDTLLNLGVTGTGVVGDSVNLTFSEPGTGGAVHVSAGISGIMGQTNPLGSLAFSTARSTGVLTEAMRIDDLGNVGIGTTGPNYLLDVNGPGSTFIHFGNSASDNGGYLTSTAGSEAIVSGGVIYTGSAWKAKATSAGIMDLTGGTLYYYSDTGLTAGNTYTPTARMVINSSGNVGIGTAVPSTPLHVYTATVGATVATFQNGTGTCTFTPTTTTWSCSSDARLKKDIVDSSDHALAWAGDMRIRDFTMKSDNSRMTGVIAQEMLKTHPDMVHKMDTGYYTVDAPNPWKLVKAIQELKALFDGDHGLLIKVNDLVDGDREEIAKLKADNEEQEAQIEDDKKEIAALDRRNATLAAQLATLQREVSELVSAHAH